MQRVHNPPNRFHEAQVELEVEAPDAELEIYEEDAKSALSKNDSPDVSFQFSVNPYRGCFHGCAYCYARASHQYWGFGAGTDFDRKIIVKPNIAVKLREEMMRRSWRGDVIVMSGNTDCYQPLEATYRLTRACLEVCLEFRNPVGIISKGAVLMRRDLDLLEQLSKEADLSIALTIGFADDEMRKKIEPWASPVDKRFETLRMLSDRGIRTTVMVAPLIPGLNDTDVMEILGRARDAGARHAGLIPLRLSNDVREVFVHRVEQVVPLRLGKVVNGIREMRGGRMNETEFGKRMTGLGPRWDMVESMFEKQKAKLGFEERPPRGETTFRRPTTQLSLF